MAKFLQPISIVIRISFLVVLATANGILNINPRIYISQPDENYHSALGVVGGMRSCGGPGQTIQMRYETCNGETPCKIPGDGQQRPSELEFIPSEDIDGLGIRFIVITENGAKTVYDRPIADSDVQGGQRYIAHETGGARKEMIGRSFTFQYILYRVENNNVEICGEADFVVVEL